MISRIVCWLGFHDWLCVFAHHWGTDRNGLGSESTVWECSRCGKHLNKQWDT